MVLGSLILCIIYIDTASNGLTFNSIFTMTLPLLVLFISTILKYILIKSQRTYLWCSLCFLGLLTIAMLILKVDIGYDLEWAVVVAPIGFMFLMLMICSIKSASNRIKLKDKAGIFFSFVVMIGCFSGIILVIILQELIVYGENEFIEFEFWGWITISLLGIGYSRKCGAWILCVFFGYLEVDYRHFKYPVKCPELNARSKSL